MRPVPVELDLLASAGDPHRGGLHPASVSTSTRSRGFPDVPVAVEQT
jgi:hypothetical protein